MMFIAFLLAVAAAVPKATAIDPASWFSPNDYPIEAQKKGIQGNATFEVDVDAQGKPTACRIAHSSGSAILDQATCDVVLKKGQFKPAMSHGKPVAGQYSQTAKWQLEGTAGTANGYFAVIVDFSKDRDHPACSVVSKGLGNGPTCEEILKKYGPGGATQNLSKVVALMSITTGGQEPYRGDPAWGQRLSFAAIDLYPPKEGSKPTCAVVAKEGTASESDPCSHYADAGALTEADKRDPRKAHIEQSLFGVRERSLNPTKCKDGESSAEALSCV